MRKSIIFDNFPLTKINNKINQQKFATQLEIC